MSGTSFEGMGARNGPQGRAWIIVPKQPKVLRAFAATNLPSLQITKCRPTVCSSTAGPQRQIDHCRKILQRRSRSSWRSWQTLIIRPGHTFNITVPHQAALAHGGSLHSSSWALHSKAESRAICCDGGQAIHRKPHHHQGQETDSTKAGGGACLPPDRKSTTSVRPDPVYSESAMLRDEEDLCFREEGSR